MIFPVLLTLEPEQSYTFKWATAMFTRDEDKTMFSMLADRDNCDVGEDWSVDIRPIHRCGAVSSEKAYLLDEEHPAFLLSDDFSCCCKEQLDGSGGNKWSFSALLNVGRNKQVRDAEELSHRRFTDVDCAVDMFKADWEIRCPMYFPSNEPQEADQDNDEKAEKLEAEKAQKPKKADNEKLQLNDSEEAAEKPANNTEEEKPQKKQQAPQDVECRSFYVNSQQMMMVTEFFRGYGGHLWEQERTADDRFGVLELQATLAEDFLLFLECVHPQRTPFNGRNYHKVMRVANMLLCNVLLEECREHMLDYPPRTLLDYTTTLEVAGSSKSWDVAATVINAAPVDVLAHISNRKYYPRIAVEMRLAIRDACAAALVSPHLQFTN